MYTYIHKYKIELIFLLFQMKFSSKYRELNNIYLTIFIASPYTLCRYNGVGGDT